MIIAAITDIEGPQLALLEFLVRWELGQAAAYAPGIEPLDVPEYSYGSGDGRWSAGRRRWTVQLIAEARPRIAPVTPSLLGTLQRHGLAMQNNDRWLPTELGEQVFLRFLDAGTNLGDVWSSGPADQQE